MKKKFLTRNKHYIDLNIFIRKKDNSEKKVMFKTIQDDTNYHIIKENNNKKYFNSFLHHIKTKNSTKYNHSLNLLLLNNDSLKTDTNIITNTSRHNHSLRNLLGDEFKKKKYDTSSKIFLNNIIKINKPELLKLLNRDLINDKENELHKKNLKMRLSFLPFNEQKNIEDYIYEKSTSSRLKNDKKITKNFFRDINNRYFIKNSPETDDEEKAKKNPKEFIKTLKKFPKINISFPLQFPDSVKVDKQELRDKINSDNFKDEKLKKKLRKALYFELNSFEDDNGNYNKYRKSLQNYINYIYDINLVPHIKNKFLYNKAIYESRRMNQILFSKNIINKEDAKSINRYLINNMKKEEIEEEKIKQREKKMKELAATNNYLQKLCLDYEDEDMPKLTSDEIVELGDFFEKTIDYKCVKFASDKLKNIVYKESKNMYKKNNDDLVPLVKIIC